MRKIHKKGATYLLFRVAGANMKPCYKKVGMEGRDDQDIKYIVVTQKLYKKGITCIPDERSTVDEDGMVEATNLKEGDIILVKKEGVYRMTLEEMKAEYVF